MYSEQLNDLGKLVSTPGGFFAFFAETISHFVDIQAIVADEIMARFVLMFGMGDLLCDSELLTTCKVLLSFIHKCNLKGFAKIRRFATKFITKILQTVDTLDIPELDKLGRGKPTHWAENISFSFKYCTAEETSLIVFLTRLLSDEQLSSCRSIVINRYSGVKLLVSGCVLSSMLSMLLSLVAGISDSRELATKVCEWISAAIPNASESQCNTFFNALDVLASLTSRENAGNTVNVHSTVVNCLNSLRLPERSSVFTSKFIAMAKTHPSQLIGIDVSRFVNAASRSDLTAFIHLMADVDVEIGGILWDKAAGLYVANPSDEKLQEFVVNQLCVGMRNSSPQAMVRFKSTVEKIVSTQPAAELLFSFCNGVLSQLSEKQTHIAVQLVPLWIFAVLAFSTSRVNKIVAESIPFAMANNITNLLKSDDNDVLERVIRVCNVMLANIGLTLLTIAEAEAQRTGLNRTAFVVISQALVTKMVKGSMSVEFLQQSVPVYISALAKLPYRIFIYSRIKDLLVKFQQEAAIASSISGVLDQFKESAHYKQLLKDSDPRVKNFLANYA
ncbi:unnamed protein product [Nippostrongylus brasiliensis]|uniref:Rif1_N domain-containing protein n=1 Tax=Nippostrongylus brasiliensis TaxID=27835 RepID=A0A0N4XHU6_NIPBR|nr:unnamed protein product [Nippostrongylus brasiliensis]